jgi:DNA-binding NarL/FixJ family response regulator
MPIRILIENGYPYFRLGLRLLLDEAGYQVVAEASTAAETAKLASRTRPDVAIIDLQLPMGDAIHAVEELHSVSPETRKILMAGAGTEFDLLPQTLIHFVTGFVLKSEPFARLAEAVKEVATGAFYVCAGWSKTRKALTVREAEILTLIAQGQRSSEIAKCLSLSPKTVEAHRAAIIQKLNIRDTAGLVRYAIHQGFVRL